MPNPGKYQYDLITLEDAKKWLQKGGGESGMGYADGALALSTLVGMGIPLKPRERVITMDPGDEALIFRIISGLDLQRRGSLSADYILSRVVIGLMKRLA